MTDTDENTTTDEHPGICTHYAEHRGRCKNHGIPSCTYCCRHNLAFRPVL